MSVINEKRFNDEKIFCVFINEAQKISDKIGWVLKLARMNKNKYIEPT